MKSPHASLQGIDTPLSALSADAFRIEACENALATYFSVAPFSHRPIELQDRNHTLGALSTGLLRIGHV